MFTRRAADAVIFRAPCRTASRLNAPLVLLGSHQRYQVTSTAESSCCTRGGSNCWWASVVVSRPLWRLVNSLVFTLLQLTGGSLGSHKRSRVCRHCIKRTSKHCFAFISLEYMIVALFDKSISFEGGSPRPPTYRGYAHGVNFRTETRCWWTLLKYCIRPCSCTFFALIDTNLWTCPCSSVVNTLGRHVHWSVTCLRFKARSGRFRLPPKNYFK